MRKLVILLAVVALFGAGCGDDKKTDTATTGTTTAAASVLPSGVASHGTEKAKDGLEVELDNFYFGPNVIEATPGQVFKIDLANEGSAPHTFTIDSLGIDVTVAPDAKAEVSVTAPAGAGNVEFYCKFHKTSSNMRGVLVVA
jgi:plastocyanin